MTPSQRTDRILKEFDGNTDLDKLIEKEITEAEFEAHGKNNLIWFVSGLIISIPIWLIILMWKP